MHSNHALFLLTLCLLHTLWLSGMSIKPALIVELLGSVYETAEASLGVDSLSLLDRKKKSMGALGLVWNCAKGGFSDFGPRLRYSAAFRFVPPSL